MDILKRGPESEVMDLPKKLRESVALKDVQLHIDVDGYKVGGELGGQESICTRLGAQAGRKR